jgi:hypothetical protein
VQTFTEDEDLTLILGQDEADAAAFAYYLVTEWITLTVHSALYGVRLAAAVSGTLADPGISANMVSATRHDHLFVPAGTASQVVRLLEDLARWRRCLKTMPPSALRAHRCGIWGGSMSLCGFMTLRQDALVDRYQEWVRHGARSSWSVSTISWHQVTAAFTARWAWRAPRPVRGPAGPCPVP